MTTRTTAMFRNRRPPQAPTRRSLRLRRNPPEPTDDDDTDSTAADNSGSKEEANAIGDPFRGECRQQNIAENCYSCCCCFSFVCITPNGGEGESALSLVASAGCLRRGGVRKCRAHRARAAHAPRPEPPHTSTGQANSHACLCVKPAQERNRIGQVAGMSLS